MKAHMHQLGELTSGGVAVFGRRRSTVGFKVTSGEVAIFVARRSTVGFESTDLGDRSTENRGF